MNRAPSFTATTHSTSAALGPCGTLGRGELLCQAYESYRSLVGTPLIGFEHAVFLLGALWRGEELVLASCRDCGAMLVADRWSISAPRCSVCAPAVRPPALPPQS
jgi:hypothetical protein